MGSQLFSQSCSLRIPEEDLCPEGNDEHGKAPVFKMPPPLPRETRQHRPPHPIERPHKKGKQERGKRKEVGQRKENNLAKHSNLLPAIEEHAEDEGEMGAGTEAPRDNGELN